MPVCRDGRLPLSFAQERLWLVDQLDPGSTAYSMRGAYRLSKTEIADTLERMLGTAQLDIEDRDLVRAALADYRSGPADFADHLIGRRNHAHGCSKTATFDARLKRGELFRVLPA